MTCINVGYGDSLLLKWKDTVMLIDGGSALESEFEGFPARIRSADYLQKTGIGRIDTLIITHIHEDHVCGLTALFDKAGEAVCEKRKKPMRANTTKTVTATPPCRGTYRSIIIWDWGTVTLTPKRWNITTG